MQNSVVPDPPGRQAGEIDGEAKQHEARLDEGHEQQWWQDRQRRLGIGRQGAQADRTRHAAWSSVDPIERRDEAQQQHREQGLAQGQPLIEQEERIQGGEASRQQSHARGENALADIADQPGLERDGKRLDQANQVKVRPQHGEYSCGKRHFSCPRGLGDELAGGAQMRGRVEKSKFIGQYRMPREIAEVDDPGRDQPNCATDHQGSGKGQDTPPASTIRRAGVVVILSNFAPIMRPLRAGSARAILAKRTRAGNVPPNCAAARSHFAILGADKGNNPDDPSQS